MDGEDLKLFQLKYSIVTSRLGNPKTVFSFQLNILIFLLYRLSVLKSDKAAFIYFVYGFLEDCVLRVSLSFTFSYCCFAITTLFMSVHALHWVLLSLFYISSFFFFYSLQIAS